MLPSPKGESLVLKCLHIANLSLRIVQKSVYSTNISPSRSRLEESRLLLLCWWILDRKPEGASLVTPRDSTMYRYLSSRFLDSRLGQNNTKGFQVDCIIILHFPIETNAFSSLPCISCWLDSPRPLHCRLTRNNFCHLATKKGKELSLRKFRIGLRI